MDLDYSMFCTAFAGEFSNASQAQEDPLWYTSTYLWQRSIPSLAHTLSVPPDREDTTDRCLFFLEQAPTLHRDRPYRQRLFLVGLSAQTGQLWGQYYQLLHPENWMGAAQNPDRLAQLCPEDVHLLPGCCLEISAAEPSLESSKRSFQAELPPGQLCSFEYNQQRRYVSVGFALEQGAAGQVILWSRDKGVDPQTGQGLWGALMGAYRFEKLSKS